MMVPIGATNAPQALECRGIADVAAKRIAGVGRIGDQAAIAYDLGRATDQSQLRILTM
jgi:hypothetical protein